MQLPDLSKLCLTSHFSTDHLSVASIVASPTAIHSFTGAGYGESSTGVLKDLVAFVTHTTDDSVGGSNNTVLKPPFQHEPPAAVKQWLQATHGVYVDSVVFRVTKTVVSIEHAAQELLLTLHAAEKGVGVYVYAATLAPVDGGTRLVMVLERGLSFIEAAQPTLVTPTTFAFLQSAITYLFERFARQSSLLLVDARVDNIVFARNNAFFVDFDPRFSSILPSWTPFQRRWVASLAVSIDVLLNNNDDRYEKFFTGPLRFAMAAMRKDSRELINVILQAQPATTMPVNTLFESANATVVGTLLASQLHYVVQTEDSLRVFGNEIKKGITLQGFYELLTRSDDDDLGTELDYMEEDRPQITRDGTVLDD